jgi:site-specific DNA recombinase
MTPTHAVKNDTRYRYYVSRPLITMDQNGGCSGLRVPAAEIEQFVTGRVRQWLLDPRSIYRATSVRYPDPATQRRLAARAEEIANRWPELPMLRRRAILNALIDRIVVGVDQIDIRLRSAQLGALLDVAATPLPSATDDKIRIMSVPIRLRRAGSEIRMRIDGADPFATAKPDVRLIKLLLRARRFNTTLDGSDGVSFATLAEPEGVSRSYFTRIVRLSYLAPDIAQAILDGRQPHDLTADKLLAHSRLPLA